MTSFWTPINKIKLKVFLLTFTSYATYTGTRLAYSTTKYILHDNDTGYSPFNNENGSTLLGLLDTVFLSCYACGLFISGIIGDRINIKYFLILGMCISGIGVAMFGVAEFLNIHTLYYFVFANIISGFGQSTGWPSNVTIMSRYFGHGSRGTVLGIWNSHGSIGSIGFKLLCNTAIVYLGWQYAFILPGVICVNVALLLLLFLDAEPKNALTALQYDIFQRELHGPTKTIDKSYSNDCIVEQNITSIQIQPIHNNNSDIQHDAISFTNALLIPGVITYSICLAFSKFICYSFIMWLPFYLSVIGYNSSTANNLSAIYDVGGILGGIIAGYISDKLHMRGFTCLCMLVLAVPAMYCYMLVAGSSELINACVMLIVGLLTLGPYTLVSSAVAADLGQHVTLQGNTKAMATVTGIIDGVGSIGGALSGVACSYVGNTYGWDSVLYMLMLTAAISALCLTRVVYHELSKRNSSTYVLLTEKDRDTENITPKHQPLLRAQK